MRVLMLSKACIVGIYQRKLEHIAAAGVELILAVPPSWRDERGEMPLERAYTAGYEMVVTPIQFNGNFHLHYYPELPALIRRTQPHIVHIDEEPYNAATWHALYAAQRSKAKTLFFSWQNIVRHYPPPFAWGERWTLNTVNTAIMGTESAAQVWREKGYRGGYAVIPQFGTDADLFQPAPIRPQRPFTVGYIGRLVPEKGLAGLFHALKLLEGDWCLRLVGGGPDEATLRTLAAQLGITERVTFVGQVPSIEVPAQYHALDALVLPSLTQANWKEQFGRVLVEAMASGVPVIGSSSGAIPDVIGSAGIIYPEGDINALAQALATLRDDRARYDELQAAGRARVLAHFTHEQIAAATVAVYEGM
ncbi:MAG: glycosyltransferase family 4 protein [Phototrophicaceae bacterium]